MAKKENKQKDRFPDGKQETPEGNIRQTDKRLSVDIEKPAEWAQTDKSFLTLHASITGENGLSCSFEGYGIIPDSLADALRGPEYVSELKSVLEFSGWIKDPFFKEFFEENEKDKEGSSFPEQLMQSAGEVTDVYRTAEDLLYYSGGPLLKSNKYALPILLGGTVLHSGREYYRKNDGSEDGEDNRDDDGSLSFFGKLQYTMGEIFEGAGRASVLGMLTGSDFGKVSALRRFLTGISLGGIAIIKALDREFRGDSPATDPDATSVSTDGPAPVPFPDGTFPYPADSPVPANEGKKEEPGFLDKFGIMTLQAIDTYDTLFWVTGLLSVALAPVTLATGLAMAGLTAAAIAATTALWHYSDEIGSFTDQMLPARVTGRSPQGEEDSALPADNTRVENNVFIDPLNDPAERMRRRELHRKQAQEREEERLWRMLHPEEAAKQDSMFRKRLQNVFYDLNLWYLPPEERRQRMQEQEEEKRWRDENPEEAAKQDSIFYKRRREYLEYQPAPEENENSFYLKPTSDAGLKGVPRNPETDYPEGINGGYQDNLPATIRKVVSDVLQESLGDLQTAQG